MEQTSDNEENIEWTDTVTEKQPPDPHRIKVGESENTNSEIVYFHIVRYIPLRNIE